MYSFRYGGRRAFGREISGIFTRKTVRRATYLNHAPPLREPADLAQHDILLSDDYQAKRQWQLQSAKEQISVNLQPVLCSNNNPTLAMSAVAAHGIALLPDVVGASYCQLGLLQALLPEWHAKSAPVYLVFPQRAAMPRKYRAFIDFIVPALQAILSAQP